MTQAGVFVDLVVVASALALVAEHSGSFEIGDYSLHRPFGDAHLHGEIAHPQFGVARQADEDVGVIGEIGEARRICGL